MVRQRFQEFWREAVALQGSVTPYVLLQVLVFGCWAVLVCLAARGIEQLFDVRIAIEIAPYEYAGAVLGLLLVFRTNAGYDRWWEARKLWGGIVNQSRNLAIDAVAYGPSDAGWRERFIRWVAVFTHAASASLRGERLSAEVEVLVGKEAAAEVAAADHMPSHVVRVLAEMLREACERLGMDRFAFLQTDRERAALMDHLGGCERILKTPLPAIHAIQIRRFILLFFLMLPFAILHKVSNEILDPLITMLVAYPMVALNQIGVELQNPFARSYLNHLPLDEISATIQRNVQAVAAPPSEGPANRGRS
jgi:putative membrane protein